MFQINLDSVLVESPDFNECVEAHAQWTCEMKLGKEACEAWTVAAKLKIGPSRLSQAESVKSFQQSSEIIGRALYLCHAFACAWRLREGSHSLCVWHTNIQMICLSNESLSHKRASSSSPIQWEHISGRWDCTVVCKLKWKQSRRSKRFRVLAPNWLFAISLLTFSLFHSLCSVFWRYNFRKMCVCNCRKCSSNENNNVWLDLWLWGDLTKLRIFISKETHLCHVAFSECLCLRVGPHTGSVGLCFSSRWLIEFPLI